MKDAKEFYRTYRADNSVSELSRSLAGLILAEHPTHVFEFGCGTGKNLALLKRKQISWARADLVTVGMDVSLTNVLCAHLMNEEPCVILGDENYLRHLANFDVVFTCSVIDHIERPEAVVEELKRIANRCVFLAEAEYHNPEQYYWRHDYVAMGFQQAEYAAYIGEDGHIYNIWKWTKPINP